MWTSDVGWVSCMVFTEVFYSSHYGQLNACDLMRHSNHDRLNSFDGMEVVDRSQSTYQAQKCCLKLVRIKPTHSMVDCVVVINRKDEHKKAMLL